VGFEGRRSRGRPVQGGRRRHRWKARIKEENVFCGIRQRLARAKRADEGNGGMRKRRASRVKEEEGGQWGPGGPKRPNGLAGCWASRVGS
jgi:hypothetical protein